MHIFSVGGAIRDMLLGRPVLDRDFVVLGSTEDEFSRFFPRARKVGEAHPVFIHRGRQYTLSTTATIDEDLWSRDLTINAMAIDEKGYLYAHPLALSDLGAKILRPVAARNFFADPLRVIRAARFKASLPGFCIHPSLTRVLKDIGPAGLLDRLAPERVGREIRLACRGYRPGHVLRVLASTKNLSPWLPELNGPGFKSAARLMDLVAGRETRVWMALVHNVQAQSASGTDFDPDPAAGQKAKDIGLRLRMPKHLVGAGQLAAAWHRAAGDYPGLPALPRLRLLQELDRHNILDDFFALVAARTGNDYSAVAHSDVEAVRSVRLPREWRNLGPASGHHLERLRCLALKQRIKCRMRCLALKQRIKCRNGPNPMDGDPCP